MMGDAVLMLSINFIMASTSAKYLNLSISICNGVKKVCTLRDG